MAYVTGLCISMLTSPKIPECAELLELYFCGDDLLLVVFSVSLILWRRYCLVLLVCLLLLLQDKVSCIPGWLQTHIAAKVNLDSPDLLTSASPGLGLQASITTHCRFHDCYRTVVCSLFFNSKELVEYILLSLLPGVSLWVTG